MSFKAVKELRTSGKLEEALVMALADLEVDSANVWNIRSISWVYYEFVKSNASVLNYEPFLSYIQKIMDLEIEGDDAIMLHENIAFQIGKMVYAVYKEQEVDFNKIDTLFAISKNLIIGKPSKSNSSLIKAFLKGGKSWPKLIDFIDFFGFDSFQESDFQPEEYNGRAISSTVEKYYNAYSKNLIDMSKDGFTSPGLPQNFMLEFLPKLNAVIEKNPEYQFLPYFKAKMLIFLNRKDEVLEAFLPFAKRKKSEFWVWEVLAETFEKMDENCFACHCKALSLTSPEEYLVGLRKDFAEMLISRGLFAEAKYEIMKLNDTRSKKGWKIPNDVLAIMNLPWYSPTQENKNNQTFYLQFSYLAEALLYQDSKEEIVVVEFVNNDKNVLNFVKDETKHGFFSFKGMLQKPVIGDVLKVRFDGNGKDGRYLVLSISKDNSLDSTAVKPFVGKVKKAIDKDFAFIDNYFVEPRLVSKYLLANEQEVTGRAILSFNKLKEKWGWKVFEIEK